MLRPLTLKSKLLYRLLNFWPPVLGAGIRIKRMGKSFEFVEVELKRSRWNSNAVGVQFGGSIYAMADPFYMLMLLHHLGDRYVIWDKAATVRFKKPGRTRLTAHFTINSEILAMLVAEVEKGNGRFDWTVRVNILDENETIIAEVDKVIYLKKKPQ